MVLVKTIVEDSKVNEWLTFRLNTVWRCSEDLEPEGRV